MKLKFTFSIVGLFLVIALGHFIYKQIVVPEVALPTITPPSAEELIARSAVEMQNPVAGWKDPDQSRMPGESAKERLSNQKTVETPLVISPICTGADTGVFTCYQAHYAGLVKNKDVSGAFADLRKRYDSDTYVVAMCHPITHVIGNEAVAKYPTVSQAYSQGDSFCWSGFYHGVLEAVVAKVGPANIVNQLNTLCADVPGKERYSFDYYNCVHGLGHGLMAMTENELFQSLELCDKLNGGWEQTSCYGGVFMENIIVDNKNHFTKYLKANEPLYPCNAVADKYKTSCYLMQTSYMLKVSGRDFAKVFLQCEQADTYYKATCWQSLGRDASGNSSSNIEATKNSCALGQNFEARSNCVIGAVKDFISYHHSDVQAKQLCAALPQDLQDTCSTTATSYYLSL